MGRRLGEYTADNTKCMVEVNGVRLIDRMLHQLMKFNLTRIVVVTGYEGSNLKSYIKSNYSNENIKFIDNPIYDRTNNVYSLWLAKEFMIEDDTLLLESDLIFEDEVLKKAMDSQYKDLALISKYETWMDGTMVRIDDENNIVNFIPKKAFKYSDTDFYFKTVNIYKFSKDFINNHYLPFLEAYIKVLGENEYYEQVLRVITLIDKVEIKALPITGLRWYEIDDVQDLRIAETIFANPEEKLKKIQQSFGGYWRYPGLLDFCYLVNPYFPRKRMIEELKANFEPLLRNYPSGMKINALLGSKYFGLKKNYVVVGNGAAELIKSLLDNLDGKIGIIYPTFEEYPNRLPNERIIKYIPGNADYAYTADELISFYENNWIDNLLIINPDNPSGNYLSNKDIRKLLHWTESKNIRLVIDESFIDFSEKGRVDSLLKNDILELHPSLVVVKSISKSYGVPGLRLGIIATGDLKLIEKLRKEVAIWNINSFAEFYMQIFNKYDKDYERACEKFRVERSIFFQELCTIPFLRVIPSQANYFLCEVISDFSSYELVLRLLSKYNILIKDCSTKKGFQQDKQYVRIAIRGRQDNKRLLESLKQLKDYESC